MRVCGCEPLLSVRARSVVGGGGVALMEGRIRVAKDEHLMNERMDFLFADPDRRTGCLLMH